MPARAPPSVPRPGPCTAELRSGAGKRTRRAQQQQAQANADAQVKAAADAQKQTYNKAFTACMEGKGYTAK